VLLIVVSIIAIIGAIWAVLARIDAEKSFKKSQEILDTLGSNFDFTEILNDDRFVKIINSIGNEHTRINLFLGFPCVGYLYKDKAKFRNKPENIFNDLNRKLEDLLDNLTNGKVAEKFSLNIAVFSFDEAKELLKSEDGKYEPIVLANKPDFKIFIKILIPYKNQNTKVL
jgi:hypothetical protein